MIGTPLEAVYVGVFVAATVGCAVGAGRAFKIEDPDTRHGLLGLLVGSGGWAMFQTAFLVAPSYASAYVMYMISLVIGLTSIFAWLYFASAFTGRTLHQSRMWRIVGVAAYLGIVALKLTNPLHGMYFTITGTTIPFQHFVIVHETIHWIITGASYVAAGIGFFMLFEAFTDADYNTRPLAALGIATALPVGLDIAGYVSQALLEINYEPLGVAVFGIGALFVFRDRFFVVEASESTQKPLLYFDANDRLRDYNTHAAVVFPDVASRCGQRLDDAFPDVAAALGDDAGTVTRSVGGDTQHYVVTSASLSQAAPTDGRVVHLTDVTNAENRRRELARHNTQLEDLSDGMRHELLNSMNIMQGWLARAEDAIDDDNDDALEATATVRDTGDRVVDIIEDFVALTRYGTTIDEFNDVSLSNVVAVVRAQSSTDVSLLVTTRATVTADRSRVVQMVLSAAEFAAANNASSLAVGVTGNTITFTDNGDPVRDGANPEDYFDLDAAVPSSDAGLALPKVRVLARLHGWDVTVNEEYDAGVQVIVTGVDTHPSDTDAPRLPDASSQSGSSGTINATAAAATSPAPDAGTPQSPAAASPVRGDPSVSGSNPDTGGTPVSRVAAWLPVSRVTRFLKDAS